MDLDRKARLHAHARVGGNLHPAMLPHLTTLVLVDVPAFSPTQDVARRIISFIERCAEEQSFARKQAQLDYTLPPGRQGHAATLEASAKHLFALRRIVLELAAPDAASLPHTTTSSWQPHESRSMTDDRDGEVLWNAAASDFSFFGQEENMFPTIDSGRYSSFSGTNETEVVAKRSDQGTSSAPKETPVVDNVGVISQFRQDRILALQRQRDVGNPEAEIEGLWDGVVQVVRFNAAMRGDEQMDYHGNKFTNHYLCR
jgi:hypothetical protein